MRSTRAQGAFTRTELIVVLIVVIFLVLMIAPAFLRKHKAAERISCVNNLLQIGGAYRVWANDNGDRFPSAVPITNRGWSEVFRSTDASSYLWTNYVIMRSELGLAPAILICPADERIPATNFAAIANTNISYFTSDSASDTYPQSILGGDRNLGPATPASDYGFSPLDGKGYDVMIRGPICWTLKMHSRGKTPTCGNILLADGSAQQTTSGNLYNNWMKTVLVDVATNTAVNPPALRLLFP